MSTGGSSQAEWSHCTLSKNYLDGARRQCVLLLDYELVVVRGDELDVHGVGALAAANDRRSG